MTLSPGACGERHTVRAEELSFASGLSDQDSELVKILLIPCERYIDKIIPFYGFKSAKPSENSININDLRVYPHLKPALVPVKYSD